MCEEAERDFLWALAEAGGQALAGGDPQRIEDALIAARPESALAERSLRLGWLALTDHLARSGDRPVFGGSGKAESWAFTARSRPWPFIDREGAVLRVAGLFGHGLQVVIVRGPGRSSFLAAVRRALLSTHGRDAIVPPVLPAARDDLAGTLRPYVERTKLPDEVGRVLEKLRYGEDFIGLVGRAGERVPVALLLDDAHLQSRSLILGAPLFLEPEVHRHALLVLAGPDDPSDDGALGDLLSDAALRKHLGEVMLPAFDADLAGALLLTVLGPAYPKAWRAPLAKLGSLAVAAAWIPDLVAAAAQGSVGIEAQVARLEVGVDVGKRLPDHPKAREILATAALESMANFHGFAVGGVFNVGEDSIEDLLFDDEFLLDGQVVGTCEGVVVPGVTWTDLPDGLHPVFEFRDLRDAASLGDIMGEEARAAQAGKLRDALLTGYGPSGIWQVIDRVWRLDRRSATRIHVERLLLGQVDPARAEAGFRRLLPVLSAEAPYRLALARLCGAGMEIGGIAAAMGQVALSDQGFQAAAAAAQRLGRVGPAGEALARLGEVRLALALPGPARSALDLARELLDKAGHATAVRRVALLQAEVSIVEGDLETAIESLRHTIDELRAHEDHGHMALGLIRLGRLLFERGDARQGRSLLDEAIGAADRCGDPRPSAAARIARAQVAAEEGELDPAYELLKQAARALAVLKMPIGLIEVAAAGLERRAGQAEKAAERLGEIAAFFKKHNAAAQWAQAWHELGRALLDQGDFVRARRTFDEAEAVLKRARDRFALVRLHEDRASALLGQGDTIGATQELARAQRFAQRLGLAARSRGIDARLAKLGAELDGEPGTDAEALLERARAEVDELEAIWAAQSQPVITSAELH